MRIGIRIGINLRDDRIQICIGSWNPNDLQGRIRIKSIRINNTAEETQLKKGKKDQEGYMLIKKKEEFAFDSFDEMGFWPFHLNKNEESGFKDSF